MEDSKHVFRIFNDVERANVAKYLNKKGIETENDNFIGYPMLNVSKDDYLKALTLGSVYMLKNKKTSGTWLAYNVGWTECATMMNHAVYIGYVAKQCLQEGRCLYKEEADAIANYMIEEERTYRRAVRAGNKGIYQFLDKEANEAFNDVKTSLGCK